MMARFQVCMLCKVPANQGQSKAFSAKLGLLWVDVFSKGSSASACITCKSSTMHDIRIMSICVAMIYKSTSFRQSRSVLACSHSLRFCSPQNRANSCRKYDRLCCSSLVSSSQILSSTVLRKHSAENDFFIAQCLPVCIRS